jgi:hypothetical protein
MSGQAASRHWSARVGRFVRGRLQPWWQDYRWPTIGVLWLLAFVLGAIGAYRYNQWYPPPRPPDVADVLYSALQLFVLNWSGSGPVPWELEVGRYLAPFMAAYTAMEALALIFFDQFQLLRARRIHDHVIICGLGNKGLLLAKSFRGDGLPVLVVEKDAENDLIHACRELDIPVFIGSASKPDVLRKARVSAARHLISVCGDDSVNAEVAAHARAIIAETPGARLTCATHIVNPDLWYLLRRWEVSAGDSFRLQFFNVFDIGARALLDAYPPFGPEYAVADEEPAGPAPRLLVAGAGKLGQNLIVQAARRWRSRQDREAKPLHVTLVDEDAIHVLELLLLRHPELAHVCVLYPLNLGPADLGRTQALEQEGGAYSAVYVCYDDDARGLTAALELRHQIRSPDIPIVIGMTQSAGLAALLDQVGRSAGGFGALHAFGLLDRACQPDLVLGGANEILARAIHEQYVEEQRRAGGSAQTNPALVPWDQLSETLKESNRRQANHLGVKLEAVGCDIAPLTDWDAAAFTLTNVELERMAMMEHERWVAERRLQGWSQGPRDPARKTNPNLVPWDLLPEDGQRFNLAAVREIPGLLAQAGFQIYRVNAADGIPKSAEV